MIQSLALRGVGANGRDLFENTATGGYLLAGKRQVFQLTFDPVQCAQTKQLMLVAMTEDGAPMRSVPVSPSSCLAKSAKK